MTSRFMGTLVMRWLGPIAAGMMLYFCLYPAAIGDPQKPRMKREPTPQPRPISTADAGAAVESVIPIVMLGVVCIAAICLLWPRARTPSDNQGKQAIVKLGIERHEASPEMEASPSPIDVYSDYFTRQTHRAPRIQDFHGWLLERLSLLSGWTTVEATAWELLMCLFNECQIYKFPRQTHEALFAMQAALAARADRFPLPFDVRQSLAARSFGDTDIRRLAPLIYKLELVHARLCDPEPLQARELAKVLLVY